MVPQMSQQLLAAELVLQPWPWLPSAPLIAEAVTLLPPPTMVGVLLPAADVATLASSLDASGGVLTSNHCGDKHAAWKAPQLLSLRLCAVALL